MIRRPPRSTQSRSSAASDVYKRQFLLNLPPDRRGRIPDVDVRSLMEFRQRLDAMFKTDLAALAKIEASNVRGNAPRFGAANVLDGRRDTYWATDDAVKTPELILDFGQATTFNIVRLREFLPLGQRIEAFALDHWQDGNWKEFAAGTSIGNCRLVRAQPITATTLLAIASVMAEHADHATGRHVAVTRATVADRIGCSPDTITVAWRLLRATGWAIEAQRGHGSTTTPTAGRRPSIYHLTPRREPQPVVHNPDLPPKAGVCLLPSVGKYSPSTRTRAEKVSPTTRHRPSRRWRGSITSGMPRVARARPSSGSRCRRPCKTTAQCSATGPCSQRALRRSARTGRAATRRHPPYGDPGGRIAAVAQSH